MKFVVIGIGAGDPEHMTVQAINALNRANIVLLPRKGAGKADLAELRREICRRYLTSEAVRVVEFDLPKRDSKAQDYRASVDAWHEAIAETYKVLVQKELRDGGTAALLVWGDPSLYDSTLRILDRLRTTHGLDFAIEVVPGITSVQALTASHAIPLNEVGNSVLFTTGRRLREGHLEEADTIVVMLDGETSFHTLPAERYDIYWGAYLGLDQEMVMAGDLDDTAAEIAEARASARRKNGWIMDVYVLRRKNER